MDNKKVLSKDAVKLELDRLILANGQATTLEVKQQLRSLDYFAEQADVHNFVEQIYNENPGKYDRRLENGTYNVYTGVSDWEQTAAAAQNSAAPAPVSISDFEIKTGPIAEKTTLKSIDDIINEVNKTTPMHKFHTQIRESSINGAPIVAEYDVRKGELKTVNDLNKGTEFEVKDEESKPASANTVFGRIKHIIVEKLGVDDNEVKLTSSFTNDLGCDSLDAVEMIMEFEKEFNQVIADDEAEKMYTVGDVVTYIEKKLSGTVTGNSASNSSDDIREPIKIFYTFADFEKHRSHVDYDPKNWVCHQRNNPGTEIHVYNKAVTRDQARSRFASKHKIKSGEVRCSTAANFNLVEAD